MTDAELAPGPGRPGAQAAAPDPDPDPEAEADGRVGYGRRARWTPLALFVLVALAVAYIVVDNLRGDGDPPPHRLVGEPAPEIATTDWDGAPFVLSDSRGRVVVLNFWAEWCAPCKEEMPAFQAVAAEGDPEVLIVGVDIKTDREENARELVRELGITYPILRDAGGDDPARGPIEAAYGTPDSYPVTVFVAPDGTVASVRIGSMDEAEIRDRIADARASSG